MYTPSNYFDTAIGSCGHPVYFSRAAVPNFNPAKALCSQCMIWSAYLNQHLSVEVSGEIVSTSGE